MIPLLQRLAPLMAIVVGGFGVYYLFVAGVALGRRDVGFALFYAVFGVAGLALGSALVRFWRLRRTG